MLSPCSLTPLSKLVQQETPHKEIAIGIAREFPRIFEFRKYSGETLKTTDLWFGTLDRVTLGLPDVLGRRRLHN